MMGGMHALPDSSSPEYSKAPLMRGVVPLRMLDASMVG
jgi:hypothetical protein